MTSFNEGQRVVVQLHGERNYATVVANGSKPESVMLNVDGRAYNPQEHWRKDVAPAIAERDMVIGDLLNLAMLKEVYEQSFLGTLWTEGDSGMLTPYVCECSLGDGLKLIRLFTINQRPNYHIIRVDSSWNESSYADDATISEHIDDILSAIEEECGRARGYCEECESEPCECEGAPEYDPDAAFPALDDECGCSWAEIGWNDLMRKIGLESPYRR